jgi:hypothetical protein
MTTTYDSNEVPALPDPQVILANAKTAAQKRIAYFTEMRDTAQAEIDAATAVLSQLCGAKQQRRSGTHNVKEETYRACLIALGNHDYAGVVTVEGETGLSNSTVHRALAKAERNGHATSEVRARNRLRYRITEDGMEAITSTRQLEAT